ncbi:MAG: ABC transporter permease subunit [Candidatus Hydrogenedentes bacterium]|nr:ABC transporter permease subunit [Candidatus Hydrogenedentota bacterium]
MTRDNLKNYFKRWVMIRERPGALESAAASLFCIALCLFIWHLLTAGPPQERIIDPFTVPSVAETFRSFPQLWFERAVARSALWSLGRVIGGFVLAAAIAVPLGVIAGAFLRLNSFLRPLSIFGRNVPVAALIPLTLMWFGLGETQKVMFIFLASVAFVLFDSASAVQGVADSYLDAAYTLGARVVPKRGAIHAALAGLVYAGVGVLACLFLAQRPGPNDADLWEAWRTRVFVLGGVGFVIGFLLWFPIFAYQAIQKVLLALALPDIVNSLRLLFGLAFGYIMLAEVINANFGLGAIIITSQRQGPREHIYLSLLFIALLAFGIDRLMLTLQRWLFPYRPVGEHA